MCVCMCVCECLSERVGERKKHTKNEGSVNEDSNWKKESFRGPFQGYSVSFNHEF